MTFRTTKISVFVGGITVVLTWFILGGRKPSQHCSLHELFGSTQ